MIKSDVIAEDDDGPEAKGAHGRQIDDLDEASRATARAPPPRGGPNQAPERSHTHFFFREGGSRRKLKYIRCLEVQKC